MSTQGFSHLDQHGEVKMVDVSHKSVSTRDAIATGRILLQATTLRAIDSHQVAKGNVLATARIAGIQAAKQTAHLIPLCHSLNLSNVEVIFEPLLTGIEITCRVRTIGQTGAEMEALTGVTVAALAIYDMCKAIDEEMQITDVRLVSKTKTAVNP